MNLYRRKTFQASLVLVVVCSLFHYLQAQRKSPHKLRATALLQITTDPKGIVTSKVIPITILDNGRFRDAGIYKAHPEPMALDTGVVYEAQKSGVTVGYVTVDNASAEKGTWTAFGKWQPVSTVAKAEAKADATPVTPTQPGDDRPVLHRGGEAASTPSPTPVSSAPAASTPTPPQSPPEPEPDDTDRPVLRRRTPSSPAADTTRDTTSQVKPSQPAPSPSPSSPAAQKTTTPGTQTLVGISDASPVNDERSYVYAWKPGEERIIESKMRKLALAQLPKENSQLNEGSLKDVVIRSFDLDMSNDAVVVLTAEIPGSYLAGAGKTGSAKFVSRYITLIARVDIDGNPQRMAVSVTDSSRLDIAPRLELIDAVDVDGDGLAELLFREYDFDQASFIVYGVGRGAVTKVFEGASMPLH
jgi:hypothetical protein